MVIQGSSIQEEETLSIPLPERAILHHILPRGYISQYTSLGEYWMYVNWEIHFAQKGNIKRVSFQYNTF